MTQTVTIYTDGACSGNPGPGGWGAVLIFGTTQKELSGAASDTTNNRMELIAVIEALETLSRPVTAEVYTDSRYVQDGITKWIHNWKARGWKTADKKPVKNVDLWKRLEEASEKHAISWHWVKGHAGNLMNERADTLARQAIVSGLVQAAGH